MGTFKKGWEQNWTKSGIGKRDRDKAGHFIKETGKNWAFEKGTVTKKDKLLKGWGQNRTTC